MSFTGPNAGDPAHVLLKQTTAKHFRLLEGFRYQRHNDAASFYVTPAALGETDLTSVPFGFRWFVNAYGRHTLPALLHDCLVSPACARIATQLTAGRATPPDRSEADDIFLEALGARDVPTIRRHLMWAAVSFHTRFTFMGWRARLFIILWMIAALVGTAVFFLGPWLFGPWASALAFLGPLPGAALWGKGWRAGLWFGYGVVLLAPASLVVHGSFLVYWLAEKVLEHLRLSTPPPSVKKF